jgi:hypothetical protein
MSVFDDYQHQANSLFEGFTGLDYEVKGWSADHPQSLTVDLTVDPFKLLQEMDGSTLGQPDEKPFQADSLTLLAVANESWRFEGEFNSRHGAADLFKTDDDSYRDPTTFTARQQQAFEVVCQFLDALYAGLCEDWDAIGEAVYNVNLSETLKLPAGVKLPEGADGWEVILRKGSNYWEHIPMSSLDDGYFDWYEMAGGGLQGGELKVSIEDADGDLLAEFNTDGIVLWKDDTGLTEIIHKMFEEHGGLEQYVPCLEEAA